MPFELDLYDVTILFNENIGVKGLFAQNSIHQIVKSSNIGCLIEKKNKKNV